MLYSSVDNNKIKDLKKLQTKKYRDKKNMFLIEGKHLVLEAYKTNCLKEILLEENELLPLDVETNYMTNNVMNYLSELETPNNIIGICNKKDGSLKGNKIVYLDYIQDPGNLGTIIRSCVAFNIDTLILSKNCVDMYNSKVIRASQGMIFHLNIIIEDVENIIPKLKEDGYKIYGTNVMYGKSLKSIEKSDKFVIIMGNEGNGISEVSEELCDEFIYIDMNSNCESLNVGVATSIILYELDK
ncbi:MAG: RNA methyltransferase [Firmicutes bacterium]|nr:RNA methyltransferase [Bacillota bacterium]